MVRVGRRAGRPQILASDSAVAATAAFAVLPHHVVPNRGQITLGGILRMQPISHPPSAASHSHSRLSVSSETTVSAQPLANGTHDGYSTPGDAAPHSRRPGQYSKPLRRVPTPKTSRRIVNTAISSVLTDLNAPTSLLPTIPSLSTNAYLPSSISSLGTTFTSAGTLPRASMTSKSVAQRRSQAPPIVVSEVKKVVRGEFDEYLSEVGPAFERWQKESRLGREGTADLGVGVNGHGAPSVGLGIGADEGEDEEPMQRKVKEEEELPPLDGVPQIFFDPAFNLSNPRTFDLVTERIQLSPNPSPALSQGEQTTPASHAGPAFEPIPGLGPLTLADLATDQILQEKLSHYTAVIESHLVREIGLRSSSFFSALSNLQSLHQQGEDTLLKIAELQAALSPSEKGVGGAAKRGLEILRGQARRRGLEKIEESGRAVEEIWNGVEAVKDLVENGEWVGALEVSEQIETMYYGQGTADGEGQREEGPSAASSTLPGVVNIVLSSPSLEPSSTAPISALETRHARSSRLNLTRVKALDGVPKKLALLRAQVAKSLESELIGVLDHEMEAGVEDYMRLAVTGAWKGKSGENLSSASPLSPAALRTPVGLVSSPVLFEDADGGEAGADMVRERAKEKVRPVLRGLVRADGMDGAVAAWREIVLREVRAMVREVSGISLCGSYCVLIPLLSQHLPTSETPTVEEEDAFAQLAVRSVSRSSIDLGSISEKRLVFGPLVPFASIASDSCPRPSASRSPKNSVRCRMSPSVRLLGTPTSASSAASRSSTSIQKSSSSSRARAATRSAFAKRGDGSPTLTTKTSRRPQMDLPFQFPDQPTTHRDPFSPFLPPPSHSTHAPPSMTRSRPTSRTSSTPSPNWPTSASLRSSAFEPRYTPTSSSPSLSKSSTRPGRSSSSAKSSANG
jgi:hypothetical protein